jgi:hypothetical protein
LIENSAPKAFYLAADFDNGDPGVTRTITPDFGNVTLDYAIIVNGLTPGKSYKLVVVLFITTSTEYATAMTTPGIVETTMSLTGTTPTVFGKTGRDISSLYTPETGVGSVGILNSARVGAVFDVLSPGIVVINLTTDIAQGDANGTTNTLGVSKALGSYEIFEIGVAP